MNILKRPMLVCAVVCCILPCVSLLSVKLSFFLTATAIIILILIVAISKKYTYITVFIAIVLCAVSLGSELNKINALNVYDGQKIQGSFLVVEETTDHGLFNSVILKEQNCDFVPDKVKILAFDYDKTALKMGDVVNVTLKLSVIDEYDKYRILNYGVGIYATANLIKFEKSDGYDYFYKTAGNIRAYVKNTVFDHFKGDTAGLLVALTTGDKTLLSDEFSGNVKTTGISHVIVVSGMHLAIIMTAVFWCIDRLFYNKYIRSLLAIAVIMIISAVCGFTMSIIRAGVMFIIAGVAPILNRDNDSLSSLLTAVTAVLIGAPFAVLNVSFQLSVLSTLAIIWVVPFYSHLIKELLNIKSKVIKVIIDTVLCSIFAIVFTLPVTIKIFGYVSVVAPLTNLIISYPVMIALIFNIVALIVSVIPVIRAFSTLLFFIAGSCSRFMVFAVNKIAKMPITVAVLPEDAFWWSLVVILAVIFFMYFYELKKKRSDLVVNSI